MQAICVDPARVHEVWPLVEPLIRPAMQRGLTDLSVVVGQLLEGRALLWLALDEQAIKAAAVTELGIANGRRLMTIVACGGREIERWGALIETLEQYAKDENCATICIRGRKGWMRMLPEYKLRSVVLEKELSDGRE